MDRSFLSHPAVVAASRDFVCVRLVAFEDKSEIEVLKSIHNRGGDAQQTSFAILKPDGKTPIVSGIRSPGRRFADGKHLAKRMRKIAGRSKPKTVPNQKRGLPYLKDLRLALNVSACDSQPLIVIHGTAKQRRVAEQHLAKLAWDKAWIGKALYAKTDSSLELTKIEGAGTKPGILFISPDTFGTQGALVTRIAIDADAKTTTAAFQTLTKTHKPSSKDSRTHVREARRKGIRWEAAMPSTGAGANRRRR